MNLSKKRISLNSRPSLAVLTSFPPVDDSFKKSSIKSSALTNPHPLPPFEHTTTSLSLMSQPRHVGPRYSLDGGSPHVRQFSYPGIIPVDARKEEHQKKLSSYTNRLTGGVIFFSPKGTTELPEGGFSSEEGGSRRLRTAYINTQLLELEKEFNYNKYLCRPRRVEIAALTLPNAKSKCGSRTDGYKRQTHAKDIHGELSKTTVVDDSAAQNDKDTSIRGLAHGRLGVVEGESNSFQNDLSVSGQPSNDSDMQMFEIISNMERRLKDISSQPPLGKGKIIHNRYAVRTGRLRLPACYGRVCAGFRHFFDGLTFI